MPLGTLSLKPFSDLTYIYLLFKTVDWYCSSTHFADLSTLINISWISLIPSLTNAI